VYTGINTVIFKEPMMAKVHEEVIVITVSKLVKNDENPGTLLTEDIGMALEQVAQELLGNDVVVEVNKA